MMKTEFEDIVLRDMIGSDIEDYVRWFTAEREWENWDAPWEKEDTSEEAERKSWTEYYEAVKDLPDNALRKKFEIEWNGRHVGWVSSYRIDENYEWVGNPGDGQTVYRAVGIDICEPDLFGKGIGTKALRAFMNYYFENGANELYTQTWSGNYRMIRCAEKLGFTECGRSAGEREVRGQIYDGLTFRAVKRSHPDDPPFVRTDEETNNSGSAEAKEMETAWGDSSLIDSWMQLIRKVRWNFPGLETEESLDEHKQTVLKFMNNKQALCIRIEETIAGVLLFSRSRNMICCLAVDPEHRKQGVASVLLRKALDELDRSKEITVSTFRENDDKGIAPRALYRKFGFQEGEMTEEFGYPNQVFVLYP